MANEPKQVIIHCETLEKIEELYNKKDVKGKELHKILTDLVNEEYERRRSDKDGKIYNVKT